MELETDIGLRLVAEIGKNTDETRRAARIQEQARRAATPAFARIGLSGVAPASGLLVLGGPNSGPSQGYFWYVRSIGIIGPTPGVAVTGRADIFVSAASLSNFTSLSQFPSTDWRDQTATIPNVAFYARGQLTLRDNETLFVVLSGLTTNQQIGVGIQIENLQDAADRQDFAL